MKIMGIDLGIHKVSYALVCDEEISVAWTAQAASLGRAVELQELYQETFMAMSTVMPDYVFIETPVIGNNRKYSMQISETYGSVLAALGAADMTVIPVNNLTWKKELVGKMPRRSIEQKECVRAWLREQDDHAYAVVCDRDQDRIDAGCIALYGHRITKRAEQLTKSFD